MKLFNPFRLLKRTHKTPTVSAEPRFTQGHRLTMKFIVELLQTLRDRQHDYYISDVLGVHIAYLTDIYTYVATHSKQSSECPTDDHQARSCPTSE